MTIRKRRQALGLTIEELAQLSGVTSVTVARVELGKTNPTKGTLKLIDLALSKKEQDNEDKKAQ